MLKSKDEALTKFKDFVNLVENQTGRTVKSLRSDNGGEYTSKLFATYCAEKGIAHQFTNPYTPEQNGVAERLNRTVIESARAMMSHASLPKKFWAEAVNTAVYVHNRSPTTALEAKTPFDCWYNEEPDVSSMKVFGCLSFVHIPDSQRKKLDNKSLKAIFIGYPEGTKGYKLYEISLRSYSTKHKYSLL